MLRVLGFFSFDQPDQGLCDRMNTLYAMDGGYDSTITHQQGRIFLIVQGLAGKEAERYRYINSEDKTACFVIGNVFSSDEPVRKALKAHPAEFLLTQYLQDGMNTFADLKGEFNVVILKGDELILINDRQGLSPMYTLRKDGGVFFGTEADAITWLQDDNRINFGAVAEFLLYGVIANGRTFIEGLENQQRGTAIHLKDGDISEEEYYAFHPVEHASRPKSERIQLAHDIFREAVRVRIPDASASVYADLSGGWDTRFLMANLLGVHPHVTAATNTNNDEDLAIAKQITADLGLRHYIYNFPAMPEDNAHKFVDLTGRRRLRCAYFKDRHVFDGSEANRDEAEFLTARRFSGLFGGELLGAVPLWFRERISQNFVTAGNRILNRDLLKKALKSNAHDELIKGYSRDVSPIQHFSHHLARTYLTTLYWDGWERPTCFFTYQDLRPYTDVEFVRCLCGFDYEQFFDYRLYEVLYKVFHKEYLKYPWTYVPERKRNDIEDTKVTHQRNSGSDVPRVDAGFEEFLRQQKFVKHGQPSESRLKELYFMYTWLNCYKSILDPSEVDLFSGGLAGV